MHNRDSMWHKNVQYVTLPRTDPELEFGAQL